MARLVLPVVIAWLAATWLPVASAAVVVIANRATDTVQFAIAVEGGSPTRYSLQPRDLAPIAVTGDVLLYFTAKSEQRQYLLQPNQVYFFRDDTSAGLDLEQIGLRSPYPRREVPQSENRELAEFATIPIKILVDDAERAARVAWEKRLRRRITAASEVFYGHARIRLEVVAVDTWESEPELNDFQRSLLEFERKVPAEPAAVAIGFTSRYRLTRQGNRFGGTRGPFHSHILLRELTGVVGEPERLEALIHELGHYLGATHSPENDSVMRPELGDRRARFRDFRIGFDPVNTLILYLVGEDLRTGAEIRKLHDLTLPTRLRLFDAYSNLAQAMPDDQAAYIYLRRLGPLPVERPIPQHLLKPRVEASGNGVPPTLD